jgi:hypothetical protein
MKGDLPARAAAMGCRDAWSSVAGRSRQEAGCAPRPPWRGIVLDNPRPLAGTPRARRSPADGRGRRRWAGHPPRRTCSSDRANS